MHRCPTCGLELGPGLDSCLGCNSPLPFRTILHFVRAQVAAGREPPQDHARIRYGPFDVPPAGWWDRLHNRDHPPGHVYQARQLLQERRIASGRELLRRITKHHRNEFDGHLLAAREYLRPPIDRVRARYHLARARDLDRGAAEVHSLAVLFSLGANRPSWAAVAYPHALKVPPRRVAGHALLLEARLHLGDTLIQLAHRPGAPPADKVLLYHPVLEGVRRLDAREDRGALAFFEQGYADAEAIAGGYEYTLGGTMNPQRRAALPWEIRFLSLIGMALLLRDMGATRYSHLILREALEVPRFEDHRWGPHIEALLAEETWGG